MLVKKFAGEHAEELETYRQQAQKATKEVCETVKAAQRKHVEEEVGVQLVTNVTKDWENSQSGLLAKVMGYLPKGRIP